MKVIIYADDGNGPEARIDVQKFYVLCKMMGINTQHGCGWLMPQTLLYRISRTRVCKLPEEDFDVGDYLEHLHAIAKYAEKKECQVVWETD